MLGRFAALTIALGVLLVPTAGAATRDTAQAEASPGPYLVGSPITFRSTAPCTIACRLTWRYLSGTRLGVQLGEGTEVSTSFATPGLKTVELRLTELCQGTTRLVCASVAYVSVLVEAAPPADTTAPTITASDLQREATGPDTIVDYTFAATDPDDAVVAQTCSPAPGSAFPVGSTRIDCSAVDSNGNVGTAVFAVVVTDTTAPALTATAPPPTEATSPAGATVTFAVSAADLVDGAVPVTCSRASGSVFPLGSTSVDCSATDAHGNTGGASFSVSVVDTTPPTLVVPASFVVDATGPAGAIVTYTATASDLAGGAVSVNCTPPSGSRFAIGTTTVRCVATDARGNASAAKEFTIGVRGAGDALSALLADVQRLGLAGHGLGEKLQSAIKAVAKGNTREACEQIGDLAGEDRGGLRKHLTAAQLAWLRDRLARISSALGCGTDDDDHGGNGHGGGGGR